MDPHPLFREFIRASLHRGKRSRAKGRKQKLKAESSKMKAIRAV
jgi:hypothetical protein